MRDPERLRELSSRIADLATEFSDVICPENWPDGDPIEMPTCVGSVLVTSWVDMASDDELDVIQFVRYTTGPGVSGPLALGLLNYAAAIIVD